MRRGFDSGYDSSGERQEVQRAIALADVRARNKVRIKTNVPKRNVECRD